MSDAVLDFVGERVSGMPGIIAPSGTHHGDHAEQLVATASPAGAAPEEA
jgi:hypothetical protein